MSLRQFRSQGGVAFDLMRFVVGPRCSLENVVSGQRSCTVRRDVLMVVSLAVQTAVSSRFQEGMLQEIRLSQFGPSEFCALRSCHVGTFLQPTLKSVRLPSTIILASALCPWIRHHFDVKGQCAGGRHPRDDAAP